MSCSPPLTWARAAGAGRTPTRAWASILEGIGMVKGVRRKAVEKGGRNSAPGLFSPHHHPHGIVQCMHVVGSGAYPAHPNKNPAGNWHSLSHRLLRVLLGSRFPPSCPQPCHFACPLGVLSRMQAREKNTNTQPLLGEDAHQDVGLELRSLSTCLCPMLKSIKCVQCS